MSIFCYGRVLSRNEKTYHRSKSYLFISHTLFHFLGIPEYKKKSLLVIVWVFSSNLRVKISYKTNVRRWQNFVFNTACNGTDGYHYETNTESEIDNGVKLSHVSYPKRRVTVSFQMYSSCL